MGVRARNFLNAASESQLDSSPFFSRPARLLVLAFRTEVRAGTHSRQLRRLPRAECPWNKLSPENIAPSRQTTPGSPTMIFDWNSSRFRNNVSEYADILAQCYSTAQKSKMQDSVYLQLQFYCCFSSRKFVHSVLMTKNVKRLEKHFTSVYGKNLWCDKL